VLENRRAVTDGIGRGEDVEQDGRIGRQAQRFGRLGDKLTYLAARVPPPASHGDVGKSLKRELDLSLLREILR
jgi:hypothetical protein